MLRRSERNPADATRPRKLPLALSSAFFPEEISSRCRDGEGGGPGDGATGGRQPRGRQRPAQQAAHCQGTAGLTGAWIDCLIRQS